MPCREEETSVFWIETDQELADAVASWDKCVGLDTEFIRTDTFYPIPGLYQVASGSQVFLIDPLTVEDWQPFIAFLTDPEAVIVMHACQEDLETLNHHLQVQPTSIFDTQFANAFTGVDYSLSYANLVQRSLGVELRKQETRSNWLQRPLREEQLAYAADDVIYLVPMYRVLQQTMQESGRAGWFAEDMSTRGKYQEPDPGAYYAQVKRAWQLPQRDLARLQALCRWREKAARHFDLPRNRLVWDDHLLTIAREPSVNLEMLQRLLPPPIFKKYANALVDAHANGCTATPPDSLDRPLTTAQSARVKALRAVGAEQAQSLGIAPELLARRKDVELCLRQYLQTGELSPLFLGWRDPLVGDAFRDILSQ
jgi:ribonuclease D